MGTGGVSGAGLRGNQPCPMALEKAAWPPAHLIFHGGASFQLLPQEKPMPKPQLVLGGTLQERPETSCSPRVAPAQV